MTITINPSRPALPIVAKDGGGFQAAGLVSAVPSGLVAAGTIGHGNTITITDSESRLGTKDQAAPRYWIFGDEVYIDGVAKDDFANTPTGNNAPNTTYLTEGTNPPEITDSRPYRHNRISRHFYGLARTHLGGFENLRNEVVAEGARDAIYISYWIRFGFNPGFGTLAQQVDSISTSPAPDFGADMHDADGENILSAGGSVIGRLMGKITDSNSVEFVLLQRYFSSGSFDFDGATVTGETTGATITFTTGGLGETFSGKSARIDPLAYPGFVGIGVNTRSSLELKAYDENRDYIYRTDDLGVNFDAGDAAIDDTPEYDDRAVPFPRWGHHVLFMDATGQYLRDRSARDFKYLKYKSAYETLTAQSNPLIDQGNGLYPTTRSSTNAPYLVNLGYEPTGAKGSGNVDFSEILVDRTPRRVVLGNASAWSQVTRVENQRTTAWAANQVQFALNLGAFGDLDNFWIYVMDDTDEPIFSDGIARADVQ